MHFLEDKNTAVGQAKMLNKKTVWFHEVYSLLLFATVQRSLETVKDRFSENFQNVALIVD